MKVEGGEKVNILISMAESKRNLFKSTAAINGTSMNKLINDYIDKYLKENDKK